MGDAKIFGVSCHPNTAAKHEDFRLVIKDLIISCKHFFLRWSPDLSKQDADMFYTIAGKLKSECLDDVVQQIED